MKEYAHATFFTFISSISSIMWTIFPSVFFFFVHNLLLSFRVLLLLNYFRSHEIRAKMIIFIRSLFLTVDYFRAHTQTPIFFTPTLAGNGFFFQKQTNKKTHILHMRRMNHLHPIKSTHIKIAVVCRFMKVNISIFNLQLFQYMHFLQDFP